MDIHVIQQLQACMLLVLGLVVFLAHQTSRTATANASVRWFFAGAMLGALGLELQSFRGVWPPVATIVLGNFCFLLLIVFLNKAIALATDYDAPVLPVLTFLAVVVTGILAFYTYRQPYLTRRVLVAALAMPVFLSPAISMLLFTRRRDVAVAARTLAVLFLAFVASSLQVAISILRGAHMGNGSRWTGAVLIAGTCLCFLWMDLLRMRSQLREMAMTDPLTGLLNRRALEMMAPRELAWASRRQAALSLLTIDIDHFKGINDMHGHMIGDAALLAVADSIRRATRKQDLAVRIGGDEFMVLLVDSSEAVAETVVARLESNLVRVDLRTHERTPFDVTVTVGRYTLVPNNETTYADLVHASDIDLYRRKQLRA